MEGSAEVGKTVKEEEPTFIENPEGSATSQSSPVQITPLSPSPINDTTRFKRSSLLPHVMDPASSPTKSLSIDSTRSPDLSPSQDQTRSLQTSRPAPASPAPSRPSSAILDTSSSSFARDRSASTSSSKGGRRVSGVSASGSVSVSRGPRSRASSRARPRSMLGTNVTVPEPPTPESEREGEEGEEAETGAGLGESEETQEKRAETIPEYPQSHVVIQDHPHGQTTSRQSGGSTPTLSTPATETEPQPTLEPLRGAGNTAESSSTTEYTKVVIVRDFAYTSTDERHHGRGQIDPRGSTSSGGGFRWPWKSGAEGGGTDSPDTNEGGSGGWGGFGFMGGWRGFGNRSKGPGGAENQDDDDDGDEGGADGDYPIGEVGLEEGEYYSSPAQSEIDDGYSYNLLPPLPADEEPKGLYRAAYAFEALSSSEMALTEGDLLHISGRGNGDPGWVIARRAILDDGRVVGKEEKVGLVPEGYLERVEVLEQ